jgi:hypothetical protein
VLVRAFGIPGAALSWTLRCAADLALYEWATRRAIGRCEIDVAEITRARRLALLGVGLAATFAVIAWRNTSSVTTGLALVTAGFVAYGILAWTNVFSAEERAAWLSMFSRQRQAV